MDRFSLELFTLQRHHDMVRAAEANARLRGWKPQPRVSQLVAARLRSLADRLDRPEPKFNVVSGSR
jgi:hypothetical protein